MARSLFHTLAVAALALFAAASLAGDELFSLKDPKNDDFGAGDIRYPADSGFKEGDLDLIAFSAELDDKGVWFRAEFGNRVRHPRYRSTKLGPQPLIELVRYDFYAMNVDVYIDTDGQPGSGSVSTLPGRKVELDRASAWEKAVIATPRPDVGRSLLKDFMTRSQRLQFEAENGAIDDETDRELKQQVSQLVDDRFFFPTKMTVRGRALRFFVPFEFLGGPPRAGWRYLVMVTGADPEQRLDLPFLGREDTGVMLLPLRRGLPMETFGVVNGDPSQPPIIDLLAPTEAQQRRWLSTYDGMSQLNAKLPALPLGEDWTRAAAAYDRGLPEREQETPAVSAAPEPEKPAVDAADSPRAKPLAAPKPAESRVETPTAPPEPAHKALGDRPPREATPPEPKVKNELPPIVDKVEPTREKLAEQPPRSVTPPEPKIKNELPPIVDKAPPAVDDKTAEQLLEEAKQKPSEVDRMLAPTETKTGPKRNKPSIAERLRTLNQLFEEGLITEAEYKELRKKILAELY